MEGCFGGLEQCTVDPPCAEQESINAWLKGKVVAFTVINNHENLDHAQIDNLLQDDM